MNEINSAGSTAPSNSAYNNYTNRSEETTPVTLPRIQRGSDDVIISQGAALAVSRDTFNVVSEFPINTNPHNILTSDLNLALAGALAVIANSKDLWIKKIEEIAHKYQEARNTVAAVTPSSTDHDNQKDKKSQEDLKAKIEELKRDRTNSELAKKANEMSRKDKYSYNEIAFILVKSAKLAHAEQDS